MKPRIYKGFQAFSNSYFRLLRKIFSSKKLLIWERVFTYNNADQKKRNLVQIVLTVYKLRFFNFHYFISSRF
nr:MAG TPA: hypothetical protein [Caudoviricetes sp.]